MLYTAGDGYSALFTPVSGSTTAFTAPAGVKADLVKTGTGYTLTSRTTATVVTFNTDGQTISFADRTANARFTYPSGMQTLVAGPDTDQGVAVATGPHTTYALTTAGGSPARRIRWAGPGRQPIPGISTPSPRRRAPGPPQA
ncbi:hypothetical protein [Arthrobacter sp. A5]|uniref:hypothetical protein n=1 Tax=Arthrobacter sp. A5 TaxID=576926 RepID=UPI003DA99D2B